MKTIQELSFGFSDANEFSHKKAYLLIPYIQVESATLFASARNA